MQVNIYVGCVFMHAHKVLKFNFVKKRKSVADAGLPQSMESEVSKLEGKLRDQRQTTGPGSS